MLAAPGQPCCPTEHASSLLGLGPITTLYEYPNGDVAVGNVSHFAMTLGVSLSAPFRWSALLQGLAGKEAAGYVPPKAPPGHAGQHQILFDASVLIQQEYRRLLER